MVRRLQGEPSKIAKLIATAYVLLPEECHIKKIGYFCETTNRPEFDFSWHGKVNGFRESLGHYEYLTQEALEKYEAKCVAIFKRPK